MVNLICISFLSESSVAEKFIFFIHTQTQRRKTYFYTETHLLLSASVFLKTVLSPFSKKFKRRYREK